MDSTSFRHATTKVLPYEIYGEIVQNLRDPKDRKALLSLSLVNTVWRELSQHVLYQEFCDDWVNLHDIRAVSARHKRFLSSIIDYPTRLGPLVRTYAQFWLVNDDAGEDTDRLLATTVEALPAMVNLQHLHITPMSLSAMPQDMFKNCVFRLQSLTMLLHVTLSGPILDFLRTQPQLRHLSIAPSPTLTAPWEADLSGLPEDVCPNLTSTSCSYLSSAHVSKGRNLVALKVMLDFEEMNQLHLSPDKLDFGHLKYLSLWTPADQRRSNMMEITGTEVILLELQVPQIKVCQLNSWLVSFGGRMTIFLQSTVRNSSLWHLPNLRTLVLIGNDQEDFTSSFKRVLKKAFVNLPKLEFIVIDLSDDDNGYRFSMPERNSNSESSELRRERIYLPHDKTRPWWIQYDGIPHIGRPY